MARRDIKVVFFPVFICKLRKKVISLPSNGDAAALSRGIKGNLVKVQSSTRYCKFHCRKYLKTTVAHDGKVYFREQVRKPATHRKITLSTG